MNTLLYPLNNKAEGLYKISLIQLNFKINEF